MKKILLAITLLTAAAIPLRAQQPAVTAPDSASADTVVWPSQAVPIRLTARSYGDSIVIRWAVDNAGVWMAANQYGWDLYRSSDDPADNSFFLDTVGIPDSLRSPQTDTVWMRHITAGGPLHPLTLDEMMARFTAENLYAGAAAQALYGTVRYDINRDEALSTTDFMGLAFHQYQEQTQRQFLAYLAAECDPQVASALALRYVDRDVKRGRLYEYNIESLVPQSLADVTGTSILVECKPFVRQPDEDMPELRITQLDASRAALRWQRNRLSGYFVERKCGKGPWVRMNTKAPVWPMNPDKGTRAVYGDSIASWMESEVVFIDSLYIDSVYTYRVQAFDAFGDRTEWRSSEPFQMIDLVPPATPMVEPVVTERNSRCLVTWKVPYKDDDLVGYYIAFSATSGGPWKTISPMLKPESRYYIDSIADIHGRGFYRVFAVDTAGNVAYSSAVLNMIEDVTPPATPRGLRGIVSDSSGVLYLQWNANTDLDLLAYKVYYANQRDHEFIERSLGYIGDTFFVDSINISTLTSEVFYYVVAVDRNHNYSVPSDTLRLRLPDFIAPGICLLDKMVQDADSVTLRWLASASDDVERYCIYRKLRTAPQWMLVRMIPAADVDGTIVFVDSPEANNVPYTYAVEAIDSARNSSGYGGQAVVLFAPSNRFDADIDLTAKADKKKGTVVLSWEIAYGGRKDYYGVVYRSADGGLTFDDVATFSRGETSWTDTKVGEGGTFLYYVELRLLGGGGVSNPSRTVSAKLGNPSGRR